MNIRSLFLLSSVLVVACQKGDFATDNKKVKKALNSIQAADNSTSADENNPNSDDNSGSEKIAPKNEIKVKDSDIAEEKSVAKVTESSNDLAIEKNGDENLVEKSIAISTDIKIEEKASDVPNVLPVEKNTDENLVVKATDVPNVLPVEEKIVEKGEISFVEKPSNTIAKSSTQVFDGATNPSTTDATTPSGTVYYSIQDTVNPYPARSIFDNTPSGWILSEPGNAYVGWVTYDFGANNEKIINKYTLKGNAPGAYGYISSWDIMGSNDNSTWTTLHSKNGDTTGWYSAATYTFQNGTKYRYYRINVRDCPNRSGGYGAGAWNGLSEMELIEDTRAVVQEKTLSVFKMNSSKSDVDKYICILNNGNKIESSDNSCKIEPIIGTNNIVVYAKYLDGSLSNELKHSWTVETASVPKVNENVVTIENVVPAPQTAKMYDGATNPSTTDATTPSGTVYYSSQSTVNPYPARNVFDNTPSGWIISEPGNAYVGWVTYDFGANNEKLINKYTLKGGAPGAYGYISSWDIMGSNDNSTWTTLHSKDDDTSGWQSKATYTFQNGTKYRYYKINVRKCPNTSGGYGTGQWNGLSEMELIEDARAAGGLDGATNPSTTDATTPSGTVYYSSQSTVNPYPARSIFDNTPSGWILSEPGNAYVGWVTYDFGANNAKLINKYTLKGNAPGAYGYISSWDIMGSNDNSTWTTLQSKNDDTSGWYVKATYTFNNGTKYRYYKINVRKCPNTSGGYGTGGWNGLSEMELIEDTRTP